MSWNPLSPAFPRWCRLPWSSRPGQRHTLDGRAVVWTAEGQPLPYADHLEMSGFGASLILAYRVDGSGRLRLRRHGVFPGLRYRKDDTRGSLRHTFRPGLTVGPERVRSLRLDGRLTVESETRSGLIVTRCLFPSVHRRAFVETMTVHNPGAVSAADPVRPRPRADRTPGWAGRDGARYRLAATVAGPRATGPLAPHESRQWTVFYAADEDAPFDGAAETEARRAMVERTMGSLRLETPVPELDAAFAFAQLRACESVFQTKAGLLHSPGGGEFYAAIWTNDQAEYSGPLFPLTGYGPGIEAALNAYRLFQRHMDPQGRQPLVSSIVAQGDGVWNGAGDRGDGAMFAYGAGRFALALADEAVARELWPGIRWALEYSLARRTAEGVVASDSDELEGRFPAGRANLFTSCLVFDALVSAAFLGDALGFSADADRYRQEASTLAAALETHFAAEVEGFATYRYFDGNTTLRAWIGVPLTVGLTDRAAGTVDALFSSRLWTENGLRTEAGHRTFWDRSTLYALRGAFAAGYADRALERLVDYSRRRLLGDHVPYPVEAWPEGNQRHLSAESGLYCRVFLEGVFGLRPVGLGRWECRPRLPSTWDHAALRNVVLGEPVDLELARDDGRLRLTVRAAGAVVLLAADEPATFRFSLKPPRGESV